jgi:hypothetical protein
MPVSFFITHTLESFHAQFKNRIFLTLFWWYKRVWFFFSFETTCLHFNSIENAGFF